MLPAQQVEAAGARTQGLETARYVPSEPAIPWPAALLNVQFLTNGGVTPSSRGHYVRFHRSIKSNAPGLHRNPQESEHSLQGRNQHVSSSRFCHVQHFAQQFEIIKKCGFAGVSCGRSFLN